MLSLIICSRTPRISEELERNIAETIGCEYELVVIDNSKNKYSIFSAYNEGVRRSKGDILCFMHDDILYKTTGWGTKVEKMLEDESIGIVGVIGSYVMTKDYGYWDMMAPFVTGRAHYESFNEIHNEKKWYYQFDKKHSNEVVAIDGIWFCMPKNIFSKVQFDEILYKGFHFYDMDICMQSLIAGYKNVVIPNIIIQHNSCPQYNNSFFKNMELFHTKWKCQLPIFRGEIKELDEIANNLLAESVKNKLNCKRYQYSYYSILESNAFKVGSCILKPFYLLKKLFLSNH